jgi:hypothetical protein
MSSSKETKRRVQKKLRKQDADQRVVESNISISTGVPHSSM